MNLAIKFANKISYRSRHDKELRQFQDKINKYMCMSDSEFLLNYTNVCARYEKSKLLITIITITLIASIVMNVWNYFYKCIISMLVSNSEAVKDNLRSTAIIIALMMIFLSVLFFTLVLYTLFKNLKLSYKNKILLEELKKVRGHQNG